MYTKQFENPGMEYRPAPFWGWNDKLEPEELRRQICEMAQKGWGGFFIHSRVGLVTDYLSETWMDCVRAAVDQAAECRVSAWLYDEDKWPSGYAGGIVPKLGEAYRARALILVKKQEIKPGDKVLKELAWSNNDFAICIRVAAMGDVWFNGACYVDLMNPDAVKAFLNSTHEKYKAAVGEHFGKEIPGVFTDEPCYLNENYWPMPAVPWSSKLPDFFFQLKKYSIEEHAEELFFDVGDYRKVRFDFYDCATRLFRESFTRQYCKWCDDNKLLLTGHFMAEDHMAYQTQWIGAAMPHYELMHWPGIDKIGKTIDDNVTVKQLTSVSDQLGKERAFCEVFGAIGQDASFLDKKWMIDWEAALGINFVNPHISLYSMRGERKRDFPPNLFYQQPWWEDEKGFADYISRLNYCLVQGQRETDVLVIHPISSVWSTYSPLYKMNGTDPNDNDYDRSFKGLTNALLERQIDFHYGDEILMEEHARVQDGKLVIGRMAYSTVVVPPCNTLRTSTLKLLEQFLQQAGKDRLVFLKELPSRIDGEAKNAEICSKSTCIIELRQIIEHLEKLCPARVTVTDILSGNSAPSIMAHVRRAEGKRIIFLCNKDRRRELRARVHIPGVGPLSLLDLTSGTKYAVSYQQEDGYRSISVTFMPAGSILLIEEGSEDAAPELLHTGVSFMETQMGTLAAEGFTTEICDENVLPLEKVSLWMNGRLVEKEAHISRILFKHFYNAAEGTPFRAEYRFASNVDLDGCHAVIELASNLDRILFNDEEVTPLQSKGREGVWGSHVWKDMNFTKVQISIKKGCNVLVIEGKKYNNITAPGNHVAVDDFANYKSTEVESVYITGCFKVQNEDNESFFIAVNNGNVSSLDITQHGYPFYAGRVKFTASFHCAGKLPRWLRLTGVHADVVSVRLNGKKLATLYWAPYFVDLSGAVKEGVNTLEIEAANNLFNLMGPNWIAGIHGDSGVAPWTFVDQHRFTTRLIFTPYGLDKAFLYD
jgi:hypothetical protein